MTNAQQLIALTKQLMIADNANDELAQLFGIQLVAEDITDARAVAVASRWFADHTKAQFVANPTISWTSADCANGADYAPDAN